MQTTHDVLVHFIKDLHSAARQQLKYYPTIAEQIQPLRDGVSAHIQEIAQQLGRLNTIGEAMGLDDMENVHCKGMEGLIAEIKHLMSDLDDNADAEARVFAVVGGMRRCKHYEIAGYETVIKYIDDDDNKKLLESILVEAKNADNKLVEHMSA